MSKRSKSNVPYVIRSTIKRWLRANARPATISRLLADIRETSEIDGPSATHEQLLDMNMLNNLIFEMMGETAFNHPVSTLASPNNPTA